MGPSERESLSRPHARPIHPHLPSRTRSLLGRKVGLRTVMTLSHLEKSLGGLLSGVTPSIGVVLDRALAVENITVEEATQLFDGSGTDLRTIPAVPEHLRRKTVGAVVTYCVNGQRN